MTVPERAPSTLLRRHVYTKEGANGQAVRKLLLWRTNKQDLGDWPAFVIKWVDYSPGRKNPIRHVVQIAADLETANRIVDDLILKEIKRGWTEHDDLPFPPPPQEFQNVAPVIEPIRRLVPGDDSSPGRSTLGVVVLGVVFVIGLVGVWLLVRRLRRRQRG